MSLSALVTITTSAESIRDEIIAKIPTSDVGIENIFEYLGMDNTKQIFKTVRVEHCKTKYSAAISSYFRSTDMILNVLEKEINIAHTSGDDNKKCQLGLLLNSTKKGLNKFESCFAVPVEDFVDISKYDNLHEKNIFYDNALFSKIKSFYHEQVNKAAQYRANKLLNAIY